jgi:carbon starvation protein
MLPLVWLLTVTISGGMIKIFDPSPKLGFLAHAAKLKADLAAGSGTAAELAKIPTLIFNDYLDAVLGGLFIALVMVVVVESVRVWITKPPIKGGEDPGAPLDSNEHPMRCC